MRTAAADTARRVRSVSHEAGNQLAFLRAGAQQERGGAREALLLCTRGVRGGDAGWGRGRGEASHAAGRASFAPTLPAEAASLFSSEIVRGLSAGGVPACDCRLSVLTE